MRVALGGGTFGLAVSVAFAAALGILASAARGRAAESVVEYRDVGNAGDIDVKQNIYFDHGEGFGGTGWPRYWNMPWYGTGGALYENDEHFWWACTPPQDAKNLVGSRAIKPHHFARFRVKADKLPQEGDLFLTLRFKDEVLAPAPVFAWSGGTRWKPLGNIGGKNDHWWKTSQFRVRAADRRVARAPWSSRSASTGTTHRSRENSVSIRSKWPRLRTARGSRPTSAASGRRNPRASSPNWARPWS
ncbi:MAG: hypothetical protein ABSG53_27400 [Thermoguttaceae bacterium]